MKPKYLLMASLLAGVYAQAQTQTHTPGQSRQAAKSVVAACKSDIQQLCPGKTGQAAQQCLQSNQQKLSSECKSAMPSPASPRG